MDKFCRVCGKEKIIAEASGFHPATGERLIKSICVDACKHGIHDEGPLETKAFGMIHFCRCLRCGQVLGPD